MATEIYALAQAHALPGMEVITVIPVGIPIRRYSCQALIYEARDYPLLGEHILKCIKAGIARIDHIAGFLGLDTTIVSDAVIDEEQKRGTVAVTQSGSITLTPQGKAVLENLTMFESTSTTIEGHFDLTTGEKRLYSTVRSRVDQFAGGGDHFDDEDYVRRLEVGSNVSSGIPEFTVNDFNKILANASQTKTVVLQIDQVRELKKSKEYGLGHIVVYASTHGEDVSFNMFIDGQKSPKHDVYLNDPKVLTDLNIHIGQNPSEPPLARTALLNDRALPVRIRNLIEDTNAGVVQTNSSNSSRSEGLTAQGLQIDGPDLFRPTTLPELIPVWGHPKFRKDAIAFAKNRLFFISPWVKNSVINEEFNVSLSDALSRGVQVDIAFGYEEDLADSHAKSVRSLAKIAAKFPNQMRLHRVRTHEKILIADQAFIATSFNWLSFAGATDRYYRREIGIRICGAEFVDSIYDVLLAEILAEREPGWPSTPGGQP